MSSADASRLVLGTAQFGLPYGIANRTGQIDREQAQAILRLARERGVDTLDTAIAYGSSEAVLGEVGVADWNVITKLPPVPDDADDVGGWVRAQIEGSLQRLRIERLHGVLLHRPSQLLEARGGAFANALAEIKAEGRVRNIGISVYQPNELDSVMPHLACDIVQAPFNLLDRRMIDSGWMQRLQALGCEVHLRSAFLQGLLLMRASERPAQFERWAPLWQRWQAWLQEHNIEPLQACLRFALQASGSARIVVGVDSARHLVQILDAVDGPLPALPDELRTDDPALLNPSLWTR